jgi:hypothetical protein
MDPRTLITRCLICSWALAALSSCKKEMLPNGEISAEQTNGTQSAIINLAGIKAPVVQVFAEGPTQGDVAARLVQSTHNDMQPTGFYVPPHATMQVKVARQAGATLPQLVVGTPFRDNIRPVRTYYTLQEGINTLNGDEYGGMVYIRYVTSATPAGKAQVTFQEGFKPVPYYRKGHTTKQQWLAMLDSITDVPDVMFVTDRTILVVAREDAITWKNEDQARMAGQLDTIINVQDAISGIDGSSPLHSKSPYKYLITVRDPAAGGYMAAGIALYFTQSLTYRILQPQHMGGSKGWGLWHEAGHIHQQGPWTWSGLGEVTVNIYAMAAERAFGVTPSRINFNGDWPRVDAYLALADRNYNASTVGLGVRLALFHQLWMQYGDNFYIKLHRQTREEKPVVSTTEDEMRYFMLKACAISGNDLSDFFRKWGFVVNESIYNEIAALHLPPPANDLTLLRD